MMYPPQGWDLTSILVVIFITFLIKKCPVHLTGRSTDHLHGLWMVIKNEDS
jgi:hypothetical protein